MAATGVAYDLDPATKPHNHACVEWVASVSAASRTELAPIDAAPGAWLCRSRADADLGWAYSGVWDGTCGGQAEYEVGMQPAEAVLYWHPQAFNALPLPLMTWFGAESMGSALEGVCRELSPDSGSWRVGGLYGAGEDYAKCHFDDGEMTEGGFDLIGAYNRSAPYLPVGFATPIPTADQPHRPPDVYRRADPSPCCASWTLSQLIFTLLLVVRFWALRVPQVVRDRCENH